MHTPASMVMGIVFAPLGLVLVFTAAITPQWREGRARLGMTGPLLRSGVKGQGTGVKSGSMEALLLLRSDGLWESCLQVDHSELKQCWPVSGPYQRDPRVRLAQGLILTSLFLCGTGIVLACIGVRCWTDIPLRGVAATGGLLVVMAGLLSLTALGVYTHNLGRLGIVDPSRGINNPRFPHLSLHPAWIALLWMARFMFTGAGMVVLCCSASNDQNARPVRPAQSYLRAPHVRSPTSQTRMYMKSAVRM
ncbi:hypothetical protein D5F01_LYC11723 [Larimichthys crocea]|uniref:Claudin n=1 Tax=Larimichthys crocea TaxID=215358 RepID=A0A6G0IEZ5_LARCR|nr:hypothetical protein D5F01_LYC11723 [Larimichthys crocea]